MASKHGFSLVELSIVLVILGLLTGGILAGKSLIRAAELRSVSTEHGRWLTATQGFRDRYFGLPGDITNATSIWGKDNAACSGNPGTATTPGTCNGNGNGMLGSTSANATGEVYQYWKQLALSGMIEGNYTGLAGPGNDPVLGTNTPVSKLSTAGWNIAYFDNASGGATNMWAYNNGNMFIFGAQYPGNWNANPALRPEEAWNVDSKIDDSKPGTGKIISYTTATNYCATSANNTDFSSDYFLRQTAINCSLIFRNQF